MRTHFTVGLAVSLFGILVACSTGDAVIGEVPPETPSASFTGEDASTPPVDAEVGLVSYCPSMQCPQGYGTCKGSRFACDVNMQTNINNCGECGFACPPPTYTDNGLDLNVYSCAEGRCVLGCGALSGFADCNGVVDDGCETSLRTNDNCGGCGVKCSDPNKPCVNIPGTHQYMCGCPSGMSACETTDPDGNTILKCVDLTNDDSHCGACGNECDPAVGEGPLLPNTKFGCLASKCGRLKCVGGILNYWGDCDNDIYIPGQGYRVNPDSNGCEINAMVDDHCMACGQKAPDGQFCFLEIQGMVPIPVIGCAPGQTFCGSPADEASGLPPVGVCVDLSSDPANCGACNRVCPGGINAVCDFGACSITCSQGTADCNGDPADGCETNTNSNPNHCGSCGAVCDVWAGQACVQGQCVLAPCDVDGGTVK